MRSRLKVRLSFYGRAVREEFERSGWYKAVSIVTVLWGMANAASLFGFKIPIPPLSWRTWLILTLSMIVVALTLVTEAVYRFHGRTVDRINAANEGITREHTDSAVIIERLTFLLGESTSLYLLLERRTWKDSAGPPLTALEIRCHESDIWNEFQNRYGTAFAEAHFEWLGEVLDSIDAQANRMEKHRNVLNSLIAKERQHKQSAVEKAEHQKKAILQGESSTQIANPSDSKRAE